MYLDGAADRIRFPCDTRPPHGATGDELRGCLDHSLNTRQALASPQHCHGSSVAASSSSGSELFRVQIAWLVHPVLVSSPFAMAPGLSGWLRANITARLPDSLAPAFLDRPGGSGGIERDQPVDGSYYPYPQTDCNTPTQKNLLGHTVLLYSALRPTVRLLLLHLYAHIYHHCLQCRLEACGATF